MIKLNSIVINNSEPLVLIAGPCVVENERMILQTAEKVKTICKDLKIPYIFKSSYKKANRTSSKSFVGIGDKKALKILFKFSNTSFD